ncbi:ZIP Zinc transporter [Coprinopsis cinerea okayama7|uniref:ZIP Zinc transporter n=1 Tax=Coprinopsis cinerea (strain Okayama-7 / 130 / ATCC MYA-4618 / FGSC 9003) TaxID=240176 RepID=A8P4B8_COPC7|nr:ZIP Zinc transporter [Coprinopsis cinerea okayama7\|eukprot:XP_001838718.2 ZIP Zinc transporter [Coprinopsis cinerea okayama7\
MAYRSRSLLLLTLAAALLAVVKVRGHTADVKSGTEAVLSVDEKELYECESLKKLGALKQALEDEQSPLLRQIFAVLFPFGPAWNAILGTFYISSIPNFILAFIPAEINANTLNTMTAFATGGLLSDVFLHLIPHSFMGEHQGEGVHVVVVEEKRNILIGLGIFVGFATFFFMEKTLRVLSGDEEGGHSHSHSHSHQPHVEPVAVDASGASKSVSQNGLKNRSEKNAEKSNSQDQEAPHTASSGPSKLSAYLNLFGDFVHNITDGLAMAASFYASPLIGATTTLACFAHEIPHEIADYSILIRSGFTKRQAMQSQFLTAIVHNATASGEEPPLVDLASGVRQNATGLLGTTVQLSDLVIPFVAGGFLYIGAVAVLPT